MSTVAIMYSGFFWSQKDDYALVNDPRKGEKGVSFVRLGIYMPASFQEGIVLVQFFVLGILLIPKRLLFFSLWSHKGEKGVLFVRLGIYMPASFQEGIVLVQFFVLGILLIPKRLLFFSLWSHKGEKGVLSVRLGIHMPASFQEGIVIVQCCLY